MDRENQGQNKQLLHYGCLVYLTFKDDNGVEYLVTADGYTKNKILLKKKEEILKESSISACLFKIYPTFYNTEYGKAYKIQEQKKLNRKHTTIDMRNAQQEIPKLIKAMEDETQLNYEQYDKYKSSPVVFGQTIQLLHINSNKYLNYDYNHVSEFESNNLKLSLIDEHSDETQYRIMACYTFQQEGSGNIYDQDIVNIVSTVDQTKKIGGEPYLHASKPKTVESKNGDQREKREVNISTEKRTPWKINIFSEYLDERDGFLCVQDTVWINYSEQDLNLIALRDAIKQKKELKIEFEQCTTSANYTKFVGNSNGLFTIESESMYEGGLVKWDTPIINSRYRLRHLTTKQYLLVIQNPNPMEEKQNYVLTSINDYQKASLFNFELMFSTLTTYNREKAQLYLQKDSYFRASTTVNEKLVWLRTTQQNDQEIHNINEEENMNQIIPTFNEIKKEEYVFKLAKANFNEVRMTNFLLACLRTIKGAEQYLKASFLDDNMSDERFQSKYKNFLTHMTRLERCLVDLQLFCHNKLKAYLYIDQEYGQINHFIQNVLREQSFIFMLVKLLCVSFPNNLSLQHLQDLDSQESQLEQSKKKKQEDASKSRMQQIKKEYYTRKKKVCAQIYKLLDCICQQNQINQEQASKFIPIFAQQSSQIDEGLKCIVQIIRDYEDLLLLIHEQINEEDSQLMIPMGIQQGMSIQDYNEQYEKIVDKVCNHQFQFKGRWDLLQFYTNLLKERSTSTSKKRDIISFLQFASTHRGKGLNVNQEGIYKCLFGELDKDEIFRNEVLIKFEAQEKTIKVYVKGEEMIFVEFFSKIKSKKKNINYGNEEEIGISKQLNNFLKKQTIMTPSQQLSPKIILSLVSEQMEFYISMCNTRNNTWKRFVESFLPYDVLIYNLEQDVIGTDMRAIICKLLNKVYIDQEPRREIIFPELCKVVRTNEEKEINLLEEEEHLLSADITQLNNIKKTVFDYIVKNGNYTEQLANEWDLKGGESKQKETLKTICQKYTFTYNKLTLEVLKVFKLLITFGNYRIQVSNDIKQIQESNKEFFDIIRQLFIILEFDPKYPESRKLLLEKRAEDAKNKDQLGGEQLFKNAFSVFGDVLGAFNVFQLMDDKDNQKDKKKKQKSIAFDSGPLNMNESFLKQADVLKKVLQTLLQENGESDQLIKLEICDILNQYLDQKMDFCLNHFKLKFKEYVDKMQLLRKLEEGELNFEAGRKQIQEQFAEVIKKCIEALIPQVLKTGTTADKRLEPPKDKFDIGLGNFANLAKNMAANMTSDVEAQGPSKEIEAIDIYTILNFEIFPTLINLFCMTTSLEMQTKLLTILTRFYNQREEFAQLASQMLLLFDNQNIKIFSDLKRKMRQLAKNIDESETWIKDPSDPNNQVTLEQTIQYFQYIDQLLYTDSYIQGERVIMVQQEKIDEFRQSIMRNLNVHELCIQLITDSIQIVDKEFNQITQELIITLFRSCFTLLKNFTINNPTNQILLSDHLSKLSLKMELDLGQLNLINEIFRNNKKVCIEKPGIVIDSIRKLIKLNGRQARFLEFFILIQKVKKEYILSNQKAVLNMLLDPAYKNNIFWLKERQQQVGEKVQQQMQIKHEFDFTFFEDPIKHYMDEPYIYHAQLIQVLFTCSIGKEGMLQNESRLRAIIPLKYALEILQAPDIYTDNDYYQQNQRYDKDKVTLLKQPLLNYIFFTYLESEKISEDIFKCIGDVQEYINSEIQRLDRMNIAPTPEFKEYYFSLFFLVMNGFFRLYQKEIIEQNLVHQNQAQVHQEIEHFFEQVKILRSQIENNNYLNQVELSVYQENLKLYFFSDNIMEEEKLQKLQKEEEEKERQLEQKKLQEEEIKMKKKEKNTFNLNINLNLLKLKKDKVVKPENFKPDDAWKQLWKIFLETFLNSKELLDEIKKEQKLFSAAFESVELIYQKDALIADHINKNEIFKKLIIFLSKGHSQPGCENTVKQVLRALCNYIIISEDIEAPDLDEEKLEEKKQQAKEEKQNFLNSNNAMATILFILSDYKDANRYDLLYNSLLSFGIQMLEGGNREVQKSVYNFFINYTSSEVFFLKLHERFEDQKAELKKEDEDEDEEKFNFQDEPDQIENTLRFLQLLVEGHYTELQNYMRFQQMNYHTYDLFTDVVELQGDYLNAKKTKYFYCMIQCFDTITEYVQGPCFENQQALFQANFTDMAQNLLGVDERLEEINLKMLKKKEEESFMEQNQIRKKRDIFPRWMYSRLKYKCSITLLSLLEGRKNNDVVFRLAKSFNLEMLKRNIIDIYDLFKSQYQDHYTEEIFGHFGKEPDPTKEEDLEYSSFIVETGFNLYVLFSTFIEVRDSTDNSTLLTGESKQDFMEQFKNNMIGELIFLAINIIQGVNKFVLDVAKNINAAMRNDGGEIDYELVKQQLEKSRQSLFKSSLKFYSQNSAHIEVQREDKMLEKTYFYVLPFCKSLDKPTKTEFNQSAKRISVKAKVTSLLKDSSELIKKMKLTYQIQLYLNKITVLALIVSKIQLYRDITFLLALTINLMILFVFHKEAKQCDPDESAYQICLENYEYELELQIRDKQLQGVITTLGIIVIVLSMLIVLFFLAQTAPLIIKKAWQGWENDKLNLIKYVRRLLMTVMYLVTDFYVLYYLSYGFTAFLGTLYNPFFFAFHLFDVLVRYPVLLNVVKAVWQPRQAILFTLFLFIVLMYVFSLVAYYWLYDSYDPNFCYSTLQCLLTAVDRSFKSDGGLGGFLIPSSDVKPDDNGYFFLRFFFDNIYFILLMIIMINIVSGIIIDTFGTLREDLNNYEQDLNNICFICGFDKETIEKSSKNQLGFQHHIKQEHYMWNYLFYIAYLKDKDPTELSGIESYVTDKIKNEDTSWFPTFKALCMNEDQEEETGQMMKDLKTLQDEQDKLQELLDNINQQLEKFEEEQNQ